MASAGAFTGLHVRVTVPAPGVAAVIVAAGSVPTLPEAIADAAAAVQYAWAAPGMIPASNRQTQAAMSRLRRRPPAGSSG